MRWGGAYMGGKRLKEQPERHRWDRFAFAKLIDRAYCIRKAAALSVVQ